MKLNGKSINYNVQTVDELLSLDGLEGDTVVVTDENRGGVFVYREANALVNNGGTIFNGWTRQYDGAVNAKWFNESLENSLFIGDGTTSTNSYDSIVTVNREVDDRVSGNGHCFSDSSDVNRSGDISYSSFDARHTISGANSYGHFAPFQNGIVHGTSGTTSILYGYVDVPTITAGLVGTRYGAYIANVNKTGGTLNKNYGLYITEQTAGASNWAVVTKGAAKSLFEGYVVNQGGLGSGIVEGDWAIQKTATDGMRVEAGTGSKYDFSILTNGRSEYIASVATGTNNLKFWGDTRTEGTATFNGSIVSPKINTTIGGGWAIAGTATSGLRISAGTGSSTDFAILAEGNSQFIATTPTGTNDFKLWGKVGFNASNPISKPTVSGSRGGNAALASLITALASYGLVTDSTTA